MKPGQFIEYNLSNIFQENSYTTCGGETIPQPFSEKPNFKNLSIKFYKFCFFCLPSWGLSKQIETKLKTTSFYLM